MKPICKTCGSDSLSRDATARWNESINDWQITDVFDDTWCDQCQEECDITFVGEVVPPTDPSAD